MSIEGIIWGNSAMMLLLFGKDMRFMFIAKMIIDHAPNRCIDMDSEVGLNAKRQEIARVLKRMSDVRNSEVVINGGGIGYRFNQEGNQVAYRCDVKRVTTINFDRKVVRNLAAEMNRRADHISAELGRCLVNSEVAYEAPFNVNDSFAEVFDAFVDSQGKD